MLRSDYLIYGDNSRDPSNLHRFYSFLQIEHPRFRMYLSDSPAFRSISSSIHQLRWLSINMCSFFSVETSLLFFNIQVRIQKKRSDIEWLEFTIAILVVKFRSAINSPHKVLRSDHLIYGDNSRDPSNLHQFYSFLFVYRSCPLSRSRCLSVDCCVVPSITSHKRWQLTDVTE